MERSGERHFPAERYHALGRHDQTEFYIQTNHDTPAACVWAQRHNRLMNSWRTTKEEWERLGELSDIRIHGACVLRIYKTTLRDLQPFPDLPFSNISQRLGLYFSGILLSKKPWEKCWSFGLPRSVPEHPSRGSQLPILLLPNGYRRKHIPRKRLATPQLTLHQFATSSSAFTKNNRKSRCLAGWSAVGSWTTPQILI